MRNSRDLDFAQHGQEVITDTNAHTSGTGYEFYALQITTAAVLSDMTWATGYAPNAKWSTLTTIPAGAVLYGRFTSVTFASGEGIAYKDATP